MDYWLNRLNASINATSGDLRSLLIILTALCVPVHILFSIGFMVLQLPWLIVYNLMSAMLFAGLTQALYSQRMSVSLALNITVIEIILHALLVSFVIGWDSGFSYYLVGAVALLTLDKQENGSEQQWFAISIVVSYVILDYCLNDMPPMVVLDRNLIAIFHALNAGTIMFLVGILASVFTSIISRVDDEIIQLATVDSLTELFNRGHFLKLYKQHNIQQKRHKWASSLLVIDVDHFKQFNDVHGHLVGDQVLRHVSQVMQSSLREVDILARWGGEEFVVLLPHTETADAWGAAERVRAAVQDNPLYHDKRPLSITITVGATELRVDETIDAVINRADQALYSGKQSGRNRTVYLQAA